MIAKLELGVMWHATAGHSEEQGVYLYAYFDKHPALNESEINDISSCEFSEAKSSAIVLDHGTVTTTTIKIDSWPDDLEWNEFIESVFSALIERGASVAWAGGEDCSWSLDTLDPDLSDGNVYAGYTKQTGFVCNCKLSDEILFLRDDQLATLGSVLPAA